MADVLLLMNTLPTYEQRKVLYQAFKDKLDDMKPTFVEIVKLMDYLSDKKCQELCKLISIATLPGVDLTHESVKQRLTDSKIALLKKELAAVPVEHVKQEVDKPLFHKANTHISALHSEPGEVSTTRKSTVLELPEEDAQEHSGLRH
jgi:hypothetical protein